jgi:hypothetical protein
MSNLIEIQTTVLVDMDSVWKNMLGGHSGYWANEFMTADHNPLHFYKPDSFEPDPQDFRVAEFDEVTGTQTWHYVSLRQLAEGYLKLKHEGWTHCKGHSLDDEDACTGDAILQYAVFGGFIYG